MLGAAKDDAFVRSVDAEIRSGAMAHCPAHDFTVRLRVITVLIQLYSLIHC